MRREYKTKVVATVGPASRDVETLKRMVEAGMDVARLNASHADHAVLREEVRAVREASRAAGKEVAILLDLRGPKLRIGDFRESSVRLREGATFRLFTRPGPGDEEGVGIDHPGLLETLKPGDDILLDDGAIALRVEGVGEGEVTCRVRKGGILSSRKGMNLPGVRLPLPSLTGKDLEDLRLGLEMEVDWVALSFVHSAEDVEALRRALREMGGDLPVVAKIEKREAVENLDEIVDSADAVMVARGDLGVEMPLEDIPLLQKRIISTAARHGKPSITATQMLQSMIECPTPTRAEVTDVANAVFDGTDAVMLSGETAVGNDPLLAVETMMRIVGKAEEQLPYQAWLQERRGWIGSGTVEAVCMAACELALQVDAAVIVAPTESGFTARQMSRFRPRQPILAPTPDIRVARRLALYWGVQPRLLPVRGSVEEAFDAARSLARREGYIKPGDAVVITAGLKYPGQEGLPTTNTISCLTEGEGPRP
ncbi:MAG: pyruvate kinase [Actinomycetota bacterium]